MNAETIREWLNRQPFEPFELRLSNGDVFQVRHPEVLAIGRDRVALLTRTATVSSMSP